MPILGIVLLLEDAAAPTRQAVQRSLESATDLELGESAQHRWPAVLEAPGQREAETRIDALRATPGVAAVEVVYADFEDLLERAPSALAREERP